MQKKVTIENISTQIKLYYCNYNNYTIENNPISPALHYSKLPTLSAERTIAHHFLFSSKDLFFYLNFLHTLILFFWIVYSLN